MQQACEEVLRFAGEAAPNNLDKDLLRLRAIERSLAILGEAAKRVPMDFRERWPALQWRAITGLRDVLVHDYFGVDLAAVRFLRAPRHAGCGTGTDFQREANGRLAIKIDRSNSPPSEPSKRSY